MVEPLPPRRADWRDRLIRFLALAAAKPFAPGRHDCALFAAGAVTAMTGADPARGWRGYRSLAAGRRKLEAAGYADQVALAAAICPEIAPAFAGVGDLAVLPADEVGAALGVVQGPGIYCLRPSGLAVVSRLHAQRAFRV